MAEKIEIVNKFAQQFGNERWWPDNAFARFITSLTEKQTLREKDIEKLVKAGYKIEYSGLQSAKLEQLGAKRK